MKSAQQIGADTSFVLRLLVGEPKAQAEAAVRELDRRIAKGEMLAVSDLVVAETYFALQHHYEVPKQVALNTLREFVDSPEINPLGVAGSVLSEANLARANLGFVDRMIHADYFSKTSGMLSFEKAASKLAGCKVPG